MTPTAKSLEPVDMRRLSPDAQEALRRRVVNAVLTEGLTQTAAARMFGVSRVSVNGWMKAIKEAGDTALASGRRGRPAESGAALKPWQAATVCNIMRAGCPDQMKLPFALWTREAVQRLIHEKFGMELAVTTVGNYLRRWGFTVQKPTVRAYERSDAKVRAWLEEEYPAILRRAKAEGALVWWGDETGVRSRHVAGRTYSPKGETPIVRATGKYFGCNLISAITNRGELVFMLYDGKFNATVFQEFLGRLLGTTDKKVFLVLDNLRVHRAKVLQPWLEANKSRIELFFLPPYSPDLNPDEILNQDIKTNSVGKRRARDRDQLVANTTAHLEARARTPDVIASFFGERHVQYAAA